MKKLLMGVFVLIGVSFISPLWAQEVVSEVDGLEVTVVDASGKSSTDSITSEKTVVESTAIEVIEETTLEKVAAVQEKVEEAPKKSVPPEAVQTASVPALLSGSALLEARQLVDAGEKEGAARVLKEALPSLTAGDRVAAQDFLAQINNDRLFAKKSTFPGLVEHVVKPGESLYVIAKKYKTTPELIAMLNSVKGTVIFPDQKLRVANMPFAVRVSKSQNRMEVYLGDELVRIYSVATGKDNSSPIGTFTIVTKLENPTWYKTGAVVPPGDKENILGTRWLGFSLKGYGIHGTTLPESIGTQATAGCVRMLNADVEELFAMIPMSSVITIVD